MYSHVNNEFVYNLVLSLTGVDIKTIDSKHVDELVIDCLNLFMDYISEYVQEKYSHKDAIRLRTAYETGEDMLKTFPELIPMYEDAYQAFLVWLGENIAIHESSN